jgi:hypothetical protein
MEVAMTSPLTIVGTSSVWTETLMSQPKISAIAPATTRTASNFRNMLPSFALE